MLSTLLEKLEKALNNYVIKFDKNKIQRLGESLDFYQGGTISIAVVRRALEISNEETVELMIYLETKGILNSKYKIYCPDKSECIIEEKYDDIRKIPKNYCDKCDENCMYLENIAVVFEVV